jgi:hypothetical protein
MLIVFQKIFFYKKLPENPGLSSPGMNGSPKLGQQKAGRAEVPCGIMWLWPNTGKATTPLIS